MNLTVLSIEEFLAETASSSPAPGGGSVAALAGALSAALASMVAKLTDGEKYADVSAEMKEIAQRAEKLKDGLCACIRKDTDSFSQYMAALRLPKESEEERAVRREAMQKGLKTAATVPLETAELALEIFGLSEAVVRRGNKNALSDGLVSAILAKAAVYGALLNVKINLGGIKDEKFVADVTARAEEMRRLAACREREILHMAELSAEFE